MSLIVAISLINHTITW